MPKKKDINNIRSSFHSASSGPIEWSSESLNWVHRYCFRRDVKRTPSDKKFEKSPWRSHLFWVYDFLKDEWDIYPPIEEKIKLLKRLFPYFPTGQVMSWWSVVRTNMESGEIDPLKSYLDRILHPAFNCRWHCLNIKECGGDFLGGKLLQWGPNFAVGGNGGQYAWLSCGSQSVHFGHWLKI